MTGQAEEVAGTYSPSTARFWWVWGLLGLTGLVVTALQWPQGDVLRSLIQSLLAALVLVLAWMSRSEGLTVMSSQGIKIRRRGRWHSLAWDDVVSVDEPDRWSGDKSLTVRGRRGELLVIPVPTARHDAVREYARAHRDARREGHDEQVAGAYRSRSGTADFWRLSAAVWLALVGLRVWVGDVVEALLLALLVAVSGLMWHRSDSLTIVSAEGIRVRRALRWHCLSWEDLAAVDEPTRWSDHRTLTVRSTAGEAFVVAVPAHLRAALLQYAQAHRDGAGKGRTHGQRRGPRGVTRGDLAPARWPVRLVMRRGSSQPSRLKWCGHPQ